MIGRLFPGLAALGRYQRSWLQYDLVAGVSVAAVAVPIAIAYSQLAGVPPAHGLYASILPLVAYAVFGSSRQLIMAPDAATCAIVAATVAPLAGQDPGRYISLSMALAMLTGVLCIAAGAARLGFLTNFLARPILQAISMASRSASSAGSSAGSSGSASHLQASFASWRSSSRISAARTV